MRRWLIDFIVICLLAAGYLSCGNDSNGNKENGDNDRTDKMEIKELENKILAEDWEALDMISTSADNSQALPLLVDLMKNEDPEVREIALNCITLIDDPQVKKIAAASLKDTHDEVRLLAIQHLRSDYDESITNDLIDNLTNLDNEVRGGVALLLGNIGDSSAMKPLYECLKNEKNPQVEKEFRLALAKRGDQEHKNKFVSQLEIPDSEIRYNTLDDLYYIGDKELASKLLPALNDTGETYFVGMVDDPKPARVCDATINLIAKWYEDAFTFEVDEFKIYSDEEIEGARKFVKSLGESHE